MNLEKRKADKLILLKSIFGMDFSVCGSLSLAAHGIINRDCNDIDISVPFDSSGVNMAISRYNEREGECIQLQNLAISNFELDKDDTESNTLTIGSEKICCIFSSKAEHGRWFNVEGVGSVHFSHPKYSIDSKIRYLKKYIDKGVSQSALIRLKKHMDDIYQYIDWAAHNNELPF